MVFAAVTRNVRRATVASLSVAACLIAAAASGQTTSVIPPGAPDLHITVSDAAPQEATLVEHELSPGYSSGAHIHHGTEQTYVLRGAIELRVAGQPMRVLHAGESFQIPRDTPHEARNTAAEPAALLISYVTDKGTPVKIPVADLSSAPPAPGLQSGRVQLFENDDVRVWRSLVLPNAPLTMHRHEHPRVIVPLKGGTMNIVDSSGSKEVHPWQRGGAYWLPTNPPGTTHADVNVSSDPIEVVVVELKNAK